MDVKPSFIASIAGKTFHFTNDLVQPQCNDRHTHDGRGLDCFPAMGRGGGIRHRS